MVKDQLWGENLAVELLGDSLIISLHSMIGREKKWDRGDCCCSG